MFRVLVSASLAMVRLVFMLSYRMSRPAEDVGSTVDVDDDEDREERPSKRARTMPDSDDEDDLLAHLRSESARQRTVRHDEPLIPSLPRTFESFEKELVTELSCEICLSLLYEPVTTPCQHVSFALLLRSEPLLTAI